MKNKNILLSIPVALGIFSCQPDKLVTMQEELDALKPSIEELKANEEEWASVKEDLGEKKASLITLKKTISDLETLIDSIAGDQEEDLLLVGASVLEPKTFESYVKVHGKISADKSISVVSEGNGVIKRVLVKTGTKVRAGQALAYIDSEVLDKNIAELKTSLEFATVVFNKQKSLYEKNVGTEIQYLEAKNTKESLENSLATLQTQRSKNTIKAPVSGTVEEIFSFAGEMAAQGVPFARIVNTSNVYAESDVSEAFYNKLSVGDTVMVELPYTEKEVAAKISFIGNFINPNNRTFKIHVSLDKTGYDLAPNMLTVVRLKDNFIKNSMVINNTSIYTDINGDYVFLLEKAEEGYLATKTYITRGTTYNSQSVITSGLKKGDLMIDARYLTLSDGDLVELKK